MFLDACILQPCDLHDSKKCMHALTKHTMQLCDLCGPTTRVLLFKTCMCFRKDTQTSIMRSAFLAQCMRSWIHAECLHGVLLIFKKREARGAAGWVGLGLGLG